MANYGRGWSDGYGAQSAESQARYADEEARRDGDWGWLDQSPRQKKLRADQGLKSGEYANEAKDDQ